MESDPIKKLIDAVEARTRAEIESATVERERAALERLRAEREEQNAIALAQIDTTLEALVCVIQSLKPSVVLQGERLELILELIKVIASWLHAQGYREAGRLDGLIRDIGRRGDMRVDIRNNRDVSTGDFIDGDKTTVKFDTVVERAAELIEEDKLDEAEDILNSLPEDMLDVALAALNGPMCAANVILQKIRGKARLFKKDA
jgi:hypothetical protein